MCVALLQLVQATTTYRLTLWAHDQQLPSALVGNEAIQGSLRPTWFGPSQAAAYSCCAQEEKQQQFAPGLLRRSMSFALWVPRRSCCCSHIRLNSRGVMQDCPCALECVGVTNSQWTMKGTGLHQNAARFRDFVATVVISVVNKIRCVEAKPEWKFLRLARNRRRRSAAGLVCPFCEEKHYNCSTLLCRRNSHLFTASSSIVSDYCRG